MTTLPIQQWTSSTHLIPLLRATDRAGAGGGRTMWLGGASPKGSPLLASPTSGYNFILRESSTGSRSTDHWMASVSDTVPHEVQLLLRIRDQDQEALAELYDILSPTLYGIAYRMMGNDAEAEDVLQDVFIRVWERAESYDPALGTPIAWLVTLTRNRAHDRLRSQARRGRLQESLKAEEQASTPDVAPTAVSGLLSRETAVAVRQALEQLPTEQRQAIELAFLGGLTQTEVAARLNEPLGTVKARIRRGMLSLRELIPAEWRSGESQWSDELRARGRVAQAE